MQLGKARRATVLAVHCRYHRLVIGAPTWVGKVICGFDELLCRLKLDKYCFVRFTVDYQLIPSEIITKVFTCSPKSSGTMA